MEIELLLQRKDEITIAIEQFYSKETFEYIKHKKQCPQATFNSIYKKIGQPFYTSTIVINELRKRYNQSLNILKQQKINRQVELNIPSSQRTECIQYLSSILKNS